MKNKVFAYVCAPFEKDGFPARETQKYSQALFRLGYIPICPNVMFAAFLSNTVPSQKQARQDMSLELLRRCRILVVCGDNITEEMTQEILLAERLGIVTVTFEGVKKVSEYIGAKILRG
jgi:hypothetical protein